MLGLSSDRARRLYRPVSPALLIVCLGATAVGCNVSSDPGERLRGGFPKHAAAVLERGSALEQTERGFQTIQTETGRVQTRGTVTLPANGKLPIVLSPRGSAEVSVREIGLTGRGEIVDRAVAYQIPGGVSYWSATAGGAEEWLLFEPGAVKPSRAAAIWEVAGATPVQRGNTIALYTEKGRRVVTVTAPAAFLADGTDAPVRLSVRGATIELFVETGGQGVLVDPSWTYVASMNEQRLGHTAARLTPGNVVVAGGETASSPQVPVAIEQSAAAFATFTAESYDPFADQWTYLPNMIEGHREHAMVTQPFGAQASGGVFVIAGRNDLGNFLSSTEVFNGSMWQSRPPLFVPRAGHSATRLDDDRVLVTGGYNDCGGGGSGAAELLADPGAPGVIGSGDCILCSAEVYDPAAASGTGDWIGTGPLNVCRALHTETLLGDGSVLVVGGEDPFVTLNAAERWSPATGQWVNVAPMSEAREFHTATRLPDGKVLVAGGANGPPTNTAEVYDPVANTWTSVGPMQFVRSQHAAALLDDGTVLITGGYDFNGSAPNAEIYDPATQQFTLTVTMNEHRAQHTETLLADGNVLVAGGDDFFGSPSITATAEIFSIIGGIGQPCVMATDCQSNFCVDGVCCDTVCDSPCEACSDAARGGGNGGQKVLAFGSGGVASAVPGGPANGVAGGGSGGGDGFCGPVFQGADPADDCADLDASTCDTTGACDGFGSCEVYGAGTACQFPGCVGPVAQGGGLCDGEGTCVTEESIDCDPYACTKGVCATECVDTADCSPFAFCDGVVHTCAPKKDDGAVAFDPEQCVSGIIADGVCCNEVCNSPCHSCSAQTGAAVSGTCSPISGFQCNDGNACTQIDTCQAGQCVGGVPVACPGDTGCQGGLACDTKVGTCSLPTAPKKPGDPCDDGVTCTTADVCDAGGECAGSAVMCTPGECQSGGTCDEGAGCQFDNKANYAPCTSDNNECTIDWCIAGACIANNANDLTPCTGGVCIGGSCIPDGSLATSGTSPAGPGGGEQGGGAAAQGGGGAAAQGGGGSGGDTGGNSAANGDEPPAKLEGSGCSTAGAGSSSTSGWAGAALALLGLFGVKRRRDARRP